MKKSEYSYLQYHWWPMALIVMLGLSTSSNKYSSRSEGKAIKIKIIAGTPVQIVSRYWFSVKDREMSLFENNLIIIYPTAVIIRIKTSIVWSWKKFNCSIRGEALSWKFKADHVGIILKKINIFYQGLKPSAMFCHFRF